MSKNENLLKYEALHSLVNTDRGNPYGTVSAVKKERKQSCMNFEIPLSPLFRSILTFQNGLISKSCLAKGFENTSEAELFVAVRNLIIPYSSVQSLLFWLPFLRLLDVMNRRVGRRSSYFWGSSTLRALWVVRKILPNISEAFLSAS